MPNILDLIQLLIDPNKNVSVCFMCFKQGNTDEMLNVYEEDIYIEGLRSQRLSLVALMKEIFPKQDIILGQACQKCVDLVLNIYTYLRRKKRIEELLHLIVDNVNKKINNQVLTNGKIYIDSVYTERSVDESRDRKINSTDDKEAGNLVNIEIEELTCPICFKAQQDLAKHLKQHKQRIRKGYSCNTCSYTTKCKTTLEGHINSKHLNCKPYICTCSKRFYTKSALAEHSKTHTHLKDVICEICGETFHYKKSLYNHLKLHYNEKTFECLVCNQRFVNRSRVNDHIKRKHGEKREVCLACGKKFVLKKELERHMSLVHKDNIDSIFDFQYMFNDGLSI